MVPRNRLATALAVVCLLAATGVAEDRVHLESGVVVRGRVVEETPEHVSVEMGGGVIRFGRELVDRVELEPRADGDAPSAGEEGPRATSPDVTPLPPPPRTEREREEGLARWAGPRARIAKQSRWLLAHAHAQEDVQATFEVLEATWRRVHHQLYRLGIEPREVRGRLPAVLLPTEPGDTPAGATLVGGRLLGGSEDVVMAPGASAHPQLEPLRRTVAETRARRETLREGLARASEAIRGRGERRRELERVDASLDAAMEELRTTRHSIWGEALSETAAASVALSRGWLRHDDPIWLRVGLPAYLAVRDLDEPTTPLLPQGLGAQVRAGADTPAVRRLRGLLDGTGLVARPRLARVDAWVLAHWLAEHHPRAFRTCVDALRSARRREVLDGVPVDRVATLADALALEVDELVAAWETALADAAQR